MSTKQNCRGLSLSSSSDTVSGEITRRVSFQTEEWKLELKEWGKKIAVLEQSRAVEDVMKNPEALLVRSEGDSIHTETSGTQSSSKYGTSLPTASLAMDFSFKRRAGNSIYAVTSGDWAH